MALLVGKTAQGFVRFGQAGATQEWECRLVLMFGLAQLVDIHLTTGADDDGIVGFIQSQHMQDVTERVHLRPHRAWQVELPAKYVLAFAVVGRQAQILDAGTYLVFVVVGGFVADGESHAASR
jgi:hypothetical protein